MIRVIIAFVCGAWLFQFQPRLPDVSLFLLYAFVGAAVPWQRWLRLPACLVLGFAWAHGHALFTRPAPLPDIDLGRPAWVTGRVDAMVQEKNGRTRFFLAVDGIAQGDRHCGDERRVQLTWYRAAPRLVPGERWRLLVKLRQARAYGNPHGFDYARWLYQQGVGYTGWVLDDPGNERLARAQGAWLSRVRQRMSRAMAELDGGGPASGLLRALVVGDRDGFGNADWAVFAATGTNHLVAISGLHIGLVAGVVMALAAALWRRLPSWCARWPARHAGAVAGTLAALGYAALAGFAIPTQRALLMLLVALMVMLAGRRTGIWHALAIALGAVVAWSPMAVNSAGLWLSFLAVAVIVWVVQPVPLPRPKWLLWGRLQLALGVALVPVLLLFFARASVLAPWVNLLAIPWFSVVLVPTALLSSALWWLSPQAGGLAWGVWLALAEPTLVLLQRAAGLPGGNWTWPPPGGAALVLALVGALLLFGPRGLAARPVGLVLLLPLFTPPLPRPPVGAFELTLLDVGQGLSAVVQTAHHVLVYDAGPRFRSGFNTGDAVVLPHLRARGVRVIDVLVASHSDSDHVGGIAALRSAVGVKRLLAGEPAELPGAEACAAGQRWRWDGVVFEILSPPAGDRSAGNNASCVLRVATAHHALLLPGDIEHEVEHRLLDRGALVRADVVVAPHHGSLSSSTTGFVAALAPRHVLYATGRDNRWDFPRPAVQARWRAVGASGWNTAHDGAVRVRFPDDDAPLAIRGLRRRHYWQP